MKYVTKFTRCTLEVAKIMSKRLRIKQRKQAVKDVIIIIVVMIPITGWLSALVT